MADDVQAAERLKKRPTGISLEHKVDVLMVCEALAQARQENERLSRLCGDNAVAALMQGIEADVAVAQAAVAAQRERDAQVLGNLQPTTEDKATLAWLDGFVTACQRGADAIRAQRDGD